MPDAFRRTMTSAPRRAPRISVVVVSYRRGIELRRCLTDLAAQRTTVPFEVVLVLQGYAPGTGAQFVGLFAPPLTLLTVESAHGLGVHRARNVALEHTSGAIIAFLDDDVRTPPQWIDTLARYYDDPAIGGVGGFVRHPGSERLLSRMLRPALGMSGRRYRIDWGGFHHMPWASHPLADQPADWLSGCNMSYRRAALDAVGGFDEAFGEYGFDDVDVGLRVNRAGWHLISSRALTVEHHPSTINRRALPDLVRDEETRRVRFVRKAIGNRRAWRARYLLRFSYHLIGLGLQGVLRGAPAVFVRAIEGARRGLALHG